MADILPMRDGDNAFPDRLPSNAAAEQALLGALLIDNRSYDRVVDILRDTDFAHAVHARIYVAIGRLIDRGSSANPVTLKDFFEQDGALAEIGGAGYLAKLAGSAVTVVNALDYAVTIIDLSRRRTIILACRDAILAARKVEFDRSAGDIMAAFDATMLAVADRSEQRAVRFSAAVDAAVAAAESTYKADGQVIGITTGLADLDRCLGGLHDSDLIILAARPAQGKSALAGTIADGAARSGRQVLFFSLEMSSDQLAARQIAAVTGVSAEKQRSGPLESSEINSIIAGRDGIAALPITIDDDPMVTMAQIRARSRRHKRRYGLGLIVVDYLQLMLSDKVRPENRVQEVSALSRGLKALAKELNIPVLALSQLSRAVEQRDDKRPMLSDLRESGSIEQDADVVVFIYREEEYVARQEPQRKANESEDKFASRTSGWSEHLDRCRGVAELLIRKNRHGATRTCRVHFNAGRTTFENLAWQQ
jgi:replicative DNA helicase